MQSPEAPTFADLGVEFNSDGYFVFVAPANMDAKARSAITDAIVAATASGKAAGMISKAFGGATTIRGAELDQLMQAEYEAAGALMQGSSVGRGCRKADVCPEVHILLPPGPITQCCVLRSKNKPCSSLLSRLLLLRRA